jgi:hypothetical protein
MSKNLICHRHAHAQHVIEVSVSFADDFVHFDFVVKDHKPKTNPNFTTDYKSNWGLWDFDVVEVFVQRANTSHYLEVQLSPLGQPFALVIEKPREVFYAPSSLKAQFHTDYRGHDWHSRISIAIDDIPGSGQNLFGNCFACLGDTPHREYYALKINQEERPDFHRPDLFISLGDLV